MIGRPKAAASIGRFCLAANQFDRTRTWLGCRVGVPEPVERYFLRGFHRRHAEWIEVIGVEGIVLPTDPMRLSLQTIVGLIEEARDHAENFGQVRLVAQAGAVSLDRVAQQYARATAGLGTAELWAALPGREGLKHTIGWVSNHQKCEVVAPESRISVVAGLRP